MLKINSVLFGEKGKPPLHNDEWSNEQVTEILMGDF